MEPILPYDEQKKQLLSEIDEKLTPWERREFVEELALKTLDDEWFNEWFGTDGPDVYDTTGSNPVDDVYDQGLERDVLDQMDESYLVDYIVERGLATKLLNRMTESEMSDAIKDCKRYTLKTILDKIGQHIVDDLV